MPDLNTIIVPYARRHCGGKTDLRNKIKQFMTAQRQRSALQAKINLWGKVFMKDSKQ